jgi:hypothetical protein
MSELAFNVNGEPFEVPAAATGWRVRRLKQKGAPEVVYGRDGLPLVLEIDAGLDVLRAECGTAGRYRLDPVDELSKPIANAQAAYVFVHAEPRNAEAAPVMLPASSDSVLIEAMRSSARAARRTEPALRGDRSWRRSAPSDRSHDPLVSIGARAMLVAIVRSRISKGLSRCRLIVTTGLVLGVTANESTCRTARRSALPARRTSTPKLLPNTRSGCTC